jgi:hypothetical protein
METGMDFLDAVPVISGSNDDGNGQQKQAPAVQPTNSQEAIVAAGGTLQRTQTQYTTAVSVQKPRDLDRIVNTVMREARFAGDSWYYSWTVKGKGGRGSVEGGSIGLAYALARLWGNCVVDIDHDRSSGMDKFIARFVDLETGYTTTRLFRAKHNPLGGGYDAARKDDMAFQAAQSKAIRNVILAGVPRWMVDAAVQEAKKATLGAIDKVGLHQAKDAAVRFFIGYGVPMEGLEQYLHKPKDDWTTEDVAHLRGVGSQIRDGANPQEFFNMEAGKKEEPKPEPKKAVEQERRKPISKPEETQKEPKPADKDEEPNASKRLTKKELQTLREECARTAEANGHDLAEMEGRFNRFIGQWSQKQCLEALAYFGTPKQ